MKIAFDFMFSATSRHHSDVTERKNWIHFPARLVLCLSLLLLYSLCESDPLGLVLIFHHLSSN